MAVITDDEVLWQIPQVLLVGPLFFVVEETGWRSWLQRALQSHMRPGVAAVGLAVRTDGWLGIYEPDRIASTSRSGFDTATRG